MNSTGPLSSACVLQEFNANFANDPNVKIPWVREDLCGKQTLVMEWIDGIRCTDIDAIVRELDVQQFIRVGVVSGLRQLLEVLTPLSWLFLFSFSFFREFPFLSRTYELTIVVELPFLAHASRPLPHPSCAT